MATEPTHTGLAARLLRPITEPVRWMQQSVDRIAGNIDYPIYWGRMQHAKYALMAMAPAIGILLYRWSVAADGSMDSHQKRVENLKLDMASLNIRKEIAEHAGDPEKAAEHARAIEEKQQAVKELSREHTKATYNANMVSDLLFSGLLFTMAAFGNWSDSRSVVKLYGDAVREEFEAKGEPIKGAVKLKHLRESENPLISQVGDYYSRKNFWRMAWNVPSLAGVVGYVRAAGNNFETNGSQLSVVDEVLKPGMGINLGLASNVAYYAGYFSLRQTGSNYVLSEIYGKTKGFNSAVNRALKPGAAASKQVTGDDIRDLYVNVYQEMEHLPAFTQNDPLADANFKQIAKYLNATYQPRLMPSDELRDVAGAQFTFENLISFFGHGGFDVQSASKTVALLEAITHQGQEAFLALKDKLDKVQISDFESRYEDKEKARTLFNQAVDEMAGDALGEAHWPPIYIKKMRAENAARASVMELGTHHDEAPAVGQASSLAKTAQTHRGAEALPAADKTGNLREHSGPVAEAVVPR
jgi:hypothetical protein